MNTFNIETETVPANEFAFCGQQESKAFANNCERVFQFRYIAGDVRNLPKYIWAAIKSAGYIPVHLGGTTYSHSVIGLRRPTADYYRRILNIAYWDQRNLNYIAKTLLEGAAAFPELKTEFGPRLVALELEAHK